MNTRKYPRTLAKAFGPYTSSKIEEPPRRMDWQDRVVLTASIVTLLFVLALLAGWVPCC